MTANMSPNPDNVLDLLAVLKERGFSPGQRAVIFSDWLLFSVHFHGDPAHPNRTPHHQESQKLFTHLKDFWWGMTDAAEYAAARTKVVYNALNIHDTTMRINYAKERYADWGNARVSNVSRTEFINLLSGVVWQSGNDIDEMEMDENDLAVFIASKSPQASATFPCPADTTLEQAHALLDAALRRAGVAVCQLDTLTEHSASACYALSKHLHKMCDAYEALGVPSPGLNMIDLKIETPYAEGSSGYMSSNEAPTTHMPVNTPYVSASNQCGLEMDEVLIHEFLHAHDALLGATTVNTYEGKLLSNADTLPERANPLWQAWSSLTTKIDSLQSTHSVAQKKEWARQGIAQRWTSMNLPPQELEQAIVEWEHSSTPDRDTRLHSAIEQMFLHSQFAASAAFRANVVVAECRLLEHIGEDAVFQTFTQKFDSLYTVEQKGDVYGHGYFENVAEKMARSIQLTLNALPDAPSSDNPYAHRWLVYPDQSLSPQITQCWKDFFALPCVQEAYALLRSPQAPIVKDLKSRLEERRAQNNPQSPQAPWPIAAL